MCICIYIYISIQISVYIRMYICAYIYTYIYICGYEIGPNTSPCHCQVYLRYLSPTNKLYSGYVTKLLVSIEATDSGLPGISGLKEHVLAVSLTLNLQHGSAA